MKVSGRKMVATTVSQYEAIELCGNDLEVTLPVSPQALDARDLETDSLEEASLRRGLAPEYR